MEFLNEILNHFDKIELFIIKTTILISATIFCVGYIWSHIKDFLAKIEIAKSDFY